MRENGLNAARRRKFIRTTDSNHGLCVCENILNRQFHAEKGGQKWVSDITYLRTAFGWVYLTVVLDLYDRKVLGWALSGDLEAAHTTLWKWRSGTEARQRVWYSIRTGGYSIAPVLFAKL